MPSDLLLQELDGAVATLTLNRPAARNAMNLEMRRALVQSVRELDEDDEIGVIILTAVDPAFSAGVDLKESTSAKCAPTSGPTPVRRCATRAPR